MTQRSSKRPTNGSPRARLPAAPDSEVGADGAPLGASGKALMILELVSVAREPLSMAELVRRSGLTKPTAHRITAALADMGLIERDHWKRGYIEGPRLIKLALDTLTAAAPRALRHSILRALSQEVGETCNFGVLSGSEVIYLDRVEAKWPLGLRFEAGSRVPAHASAIGKLLLALQPFEQRSEIIAALPLVRHTSRTITDAARLSRALDKIRESGIGTDEQEYIDGVVCIAMPVLTESGALVGAIAISAPNARLGLDQLLTFAPVLRDAATRMAATFRLDPEERAPAPARPGSGRRPAAPRRSPGRTPARVT
jgi:IclR family transcriptional regulator, acetate operon repressor